MFCTTNANCEFSSKKEFRPYIAVKRVHVSLPMDWKDLPRWIEIVRVPGNIARVSVLRVEVRLV